MSSDSTLPAGYAPGSYWYYAPNKPAPIAFSILFAISGLWHLYQCHHFHSYKATALLPLGALLFTGGFILRSLGAWHYSSLSLFVSSGVLFMSATPVYAAANFFTLGRMFYYVPYHAPMHPSRVAPTFTVLELIIEVLMMAGSACAPNLNLSPSQQAVGKSLLKAALILQVVLLFTLAALAGAFEYRLMRHGLFTYKMFRVVKVLLVSCLLITMRTLFRTVECFQTSGVVYGNPATYPEVATTEKYFLAFEGALMVLNTFLLNFAHPSRYLPADLKVYLAPDGETEVSRPNLDDQRPVLQTLVDPLDLHGLVTGKAQDKDIWEQQAREWANARAATDAGTDMGTLVNSPPNERASPQGRRRGMMVMMPWRMFRV